jgi:hypothetical protein
MLLLVVGGIAAVVLVGSGQPAQSVRLLSGSAWLPSAKVGQLTLLDGSSTEVAAQVQVATPGNNLDVVQQGSTAYAIDRTLGTVRRIDGATYELTPTEAPIPNARSGLTAFAAPNALYTIDSARGVLATADPRTLARQGELQTFSTDLTPGAAAVDDAGRLWLIDNATGELIWVDGQHRGSHRNATSPGHSVLTIANGDPVIVNIDARKATTVDAATGTPRESFDLGLRSSDQVTASGSPHNDRVYLVASRGVLIICDVAEAKCGDVVPLNEGSSLGAPVEAGNRVFVPDYTAGQVWIVDLADHSVIAKPQILTPRTQFQLLNRDNVVFFNDPDSDRAGVIQLNGDVTPTAKYDPKDPGKGLANGSDKPRDPAQPPGTQSPTSGTQPPSQPSPGQPTSQPPPVQPPLPTGPPPSPPPQSSPQSPPATPPPPSSDPAPGDEPPPGTELPDRKPPTLKITLSKTTPMVDEPVTLQVGTTTGDTPSEAQWDFGDGQHGATVMTTHHWAAAKTYQVSVQVTMPDGQQATTSASIQVTAKPKAKLTVTAPVHGTISGSGVNCPGTCTVTVDKGQTLTLTARPAANYTFSGWGGACTGTAACTVVMDAAKTVSGTFASRVDPFIGNWTNVDPDPHNLAKLSLTNATGTTATLHVWGACGGGFCDWGTTTATLTNGELHAFYDQSFATQTLRITLVNGQLKVRDHCDFQPPDTRTDFDYTDTMRKTG